MISKLKHESIEVLMVATVSSIIGAVVAELVYVAKKKEMTKDDRITSFGITFLAASIIQILIIKTRK